MVIVSSSRTGSNLCFVIRCGEIVILVHCWWEYEMVQTLCKTAI